MDMPADTTVSLRPILGALRRHAFLIILSLLVFPALALLLTTVVPTRYRAKAVLTIQSSYFRHPLVSDLISEVHEPSELNAQRQALIRLALDDEFIDQLGERYGLYKHGPDDPRRALDRHHLRERINYFALSPTTFQLTALAPTPSAAYGITRAAVTQITATLIERRYQLLVHARDAIMAQAALLNDSLSNSGEIERRHALAEKLAVMERALAQLRERYTESHPAVRHALEERADLRDSLHALPSSTVTDEYGKLYRTPQAHASTQMIYDDLLEKLSHLTIVLSMERDRANVSYLGTIEQPSLPIAPDFPKPLTFLAGGVVFGALFSLIIVLRREARRADYLTPADVADLIGVELLGELPALPPHDRSRLLEGIEQGPLGLSLPAPRGG